MANTLLQAVKAILTTAGICTAGQVFLFSQPATPTDCVTLIENQSSPPPAGVTDIKRSVQVLVRSEKPTTGDALQRAIWNELNDRTRQRRTVSGRTLLLHQTPTPAPLGRNDQGNYEWSLNQPITTTRD